MTTTQHQAPPSLKVILSQASEIIVKPLDWEKSLNVFHRPRYDASSCGRDYVVYQSEDNGWHLRIRDLPSHDAFRSAEEALTAAEDDNRDFVRSFVAQTVEAVVVPDVVVFPKDPDDSSIRELFTLNSPVARSTQEVRQVYRSLRNLAAWNDGEAPVEILPPLTHSDGWQDMSTAPTDGRHCILAVKEGAFFYAVQGVYHNGRWDAVHRENVQPLCWMPNVRIPERFLKLAA